MNNPPQNELSTVNQGIQTTQQQLSGFNNPTGYLDLLTKAGNAVYASNADTMGAIKDMRTQLYSGQPIVNVANYANLSPDQQAQIRNAARAGLAANIQSAQDINTQRGNTLGDILKTATGSYNDQRTSLQQQLATYNQRRSELEAQQKQNASMLMQLAQDNPELMKHLTPKEFAMLQNGNPDQNLIAKMGMYAEISQNRKSGGGGAVTDLQKIKKSLPPGYDIQLQTSSPDTKGAPVFSAKNQAGLAKYQNDPRFLIDGLEVYMRNPGQQATGGVTFIGPHGPMSREAWTNATHVNWQEAAIAAGSSDPQDLGGTIQGTRTQNQANNSTKATNDEITQFINDAKANGGTAEQVDAWLSQYTNKNYAQRQALIKNAKLK